MTNINKMNKVFKNENKRFEFTIYLNDNIIVQRFFDVAGFNNKAINSINFKILMDYNRTLVEELLKDKTLDFMNENMKSFYNDNSFVNTYDGIIKMVVKLDGKIISTREMDAKLYPTKVSIDVREHLFKIINGIQKCLSLKSNQLETKYLGYNLAI